MAHPGTLEEISRAHNELAAWYAAQEKSSPLPYGLSNWTYGLGPEKDEHVEAVERSRTVFMGFNPGSANGATVPGISQSERKWRTQCSYTAGAAPNEIVFTELISLPTKDQSGLGFNQTKLTEFMEASSPLNLAILRYHQPEMVFQAGIMAQYLPTIERLYRLEPLEGFKEPVMRSEHPTHTLLRSYRMEDGCPWVAIKHFASFGFSGRDLADIQSHVQRIMAVYGKMRN